MPRFRRKPEVVEAVQFTGSNSEEVRRLVGNDGFQMVESLSGRWPYIKTGAGDALLRPGQWVVLNARCVSVYGRGAFARQFELVIEETVKK